MPQPQSGSNDPLSSEEAQKLLSDMNSDMDIEEWLQTLKRADRSLYNLMALEVWSIAKTMDTLIPGFWNRFMANRQLSMQQFIQQRKANKPSNSDVEDRSE